MNEHYDVFRFFKKQKNKKKDFKQGWHSIKEAQQTHQKGREARQVFFALFCLVFH